MGDWAPRKQTAFRLVFLDTIDDKVRAITIPGFEVEAALAIWCARNPDRIPYYIGGSGWGSTLHPVIEQKTVSYKVEVS